MMSTSGSLSAEALLVEVADSGVGFAHDGGWGSGPRGLLDRIHALGGDMTVDDRPIKAFGSPPTCLVVPGVGHVSNMEAPDLFDAEIRGFLHSLDG